MQNTVGLWSMLCSELEARRAPSSPPEQHAEAARKFAATAREVFQHRPEQLRDALEIAGDVHSASHHPGEAAACFADALAVPDAPAEQRARLATKLAMIQEAAGQLTAARDYYVMAIAAHRSLHDHADVPTLLNNVAGLQRATGDGKAAEATYAEAMEEARAVHGPDDPEVALIANNLAVLYTERGDLGRAETLHLQALEIREHAYGSNHPDVGQSLANLAAVYHQRGETVKAERFYLSAIETLSRFYGPQEPSIQRIRENYEGLPQVRARQLTKTVRLSPRTQRLPGAVRAPGQASEQ